MISHDAPGYSGSGYVTNFTSTTENHDAVTVTVTVPRTGLFNLAIGYRGVYGDKTNHIWVNNVWVGDISTIQSQVFTEVTWDTLISLNQGTNAISLSNSWGWFDLDYFKVSGIGPKDYITVQPATPIAGKEVTFDASTCYAPSGTIVSYQWNFGDGRTDAGKIVQHRFSQPALMTVSLFLTDNDTNQTKLAKQVQVYSPYPTAYGEFTPSNPQPGDSVTFDASNSSNKSGPITKYGWDFGDGSNDSGIIVKHVYPDAGAYNVKLTVTNNDGLKSTAGYWLFVSPNSSKVTSLAFRNNDFRTFSKCEAIFQLAGNYSNVYDPDVVAVDAIIKKLDGTDSIVMPCFYFEKLFINESGWVRDSSNRFWMLRFTPDTVGSYAIKIRVADSTDVYFSQTDTITVLGSGNQGFIYTDPLRKQYYRRSTGEAFLPIGENVAWSNVNSSFADKTTNYYNQIKEMGSNKGNFLRYWMVPFGQQALEWKNGNAFYQGIGKYSQEAAAMLDSVFEISRSFGINIQMTLFQHGMYSLNVNSNWPDNPYNITNGGYLTNPEDFFANAQARKQTKKLLRYTVARWGYSTNLFAWELFNEVDLTGNHPNQPQSQWINVAAWHEEMASYIRSLDPYKHITTTSLSSAGHSLFPMLDKDTSLKVLQFHSYVNDVAGGVISGYNQLSDLTRPIICGEFGKSGLDENGDEVRRTMWEGYMLNLPSIHWDWDRAIQNGWYSNFKPVYEYFAILDLAKESELVTVYPKVLSSLSSLASVGIQTNKALCGYVYDKSFGLGISKVKVQLANLPYGYYRLQFFDPFTGNVTNADSIAYINTTFDLNLPVFDREIAFRFLFSSKYVHPIAIAGSDMISAVGEPVDIDGSNSLDPLGNPLHYQWTLVSKPQGSALALPVDTLAAFSLVPDSSGFYKLQLIVNNGIENSLPDTIVLNAAKRPFAIAGPDLTKVINKNVGLNGNKSYDPQGFKLTYQWTIISRPPASTALLMTPNMYFTQFKPDVSGDYIIILVVNNGVSSSLPDTMVLHAYNPDGISSPAPGISLVVYPNPANEKLYIKITNNAWTNVRISFIDLQGRILWSALHKNIQPGENELEFNLSGLNLARGFYILRIEPGNGLPVNRTITLR